VTEQIYYPSYLNRDRLVHILDPDPRTCEGLSVLFRLEGFQTTFSLEGDAFFAGFDRRRPDVAIVAMTLGDGEDGLSVLRRAPARRCSCSATIPKWMRWSPR
jgi:two-component system response regulator FixJ